MNATSIKGVWSYEYDNGIMLIDTNKNVIRVKPFKGNRVIYEIGHEITISDFTEIRSYHESK